MKIYFFCFFYFLIFKSTFLSQICETDYLVTNNHPIEGYLNRESYFPGDTIKAKIHCIGVTHDLKILRLGKIFDTLYSANNIVGIKQDYNFCSFQNGCNWTTTWSFVIPNNWKSGYYSILLTNENGLLGNVYIPFILKNKNNYLKLGLNVLASTNTWQAYNEWGDASYYKNYSGNLKTRMVSFERPYINFDPYKKESNAGVSTELYLAKFLELNDFDYQVFCDRDLDDLQNLNINFPLILQVHPEYFTLKMFKLIEEFVDKGGKLIYLGGNGMYWKVLYQNRKMECWKNNGEHTINGSIGGLFRNRYKHESSILGVEYDNEGANTYAPYKVLNSKHWVFQNLNINDGDLIGNFSENFGKASGRELDKMTINSPKNIVLLAKGTNPNNSGAEMTYYFNENCGEVFSVGSLSFTGSLQVDPHTPKIVLNVINKFLTKQKFYQDNDGDGYGNPEKPIVSCYKPTGYSINAEDCDDENPQINPNVVSINECIYLSDNKCNSTLINMNDTINFKNIPNAEKYRFEFTDDTGISFIHEQLAINGQNILLLANVNFMFPYYTRYRIRVSAKINGDWLSFGKSCYLYTPPTKLIIEDCEIQIKSIDDTLFAYNVPNATRYLFMAFDGKNYEKMFCNTSNSFVKMTEFEYFKLNEKYDVNVASFSNNVWSPFGSSCPVTIPKYLTTITSDYNIYKYFNSIIIYSPDLEGEYEIFNTMGQRVDSFRLDNENNFEHIYNYSSKGLYFVKGTVNNEIKSKKIFVD